MEKLIVNIPSFNKEAIKPGMFIEVTHFGDDKNKTVRIGGIITKVETDRITHVISTGGIKAVHLTSIINGTSSIKVATELGEPARDPVTLIVKEASTGVSLGYKRLTIRTVSGVAGIAGFDDVIVDDVAYTRLKG